MPVDILLGLQYGDEGKGKIVDVLTPRYDIVARFQGGPNAGHTIEFNSKKYVLHLIPSGIFHADCLCLVGNGVVIDPVTLRREVVALDEAGVPVKKNLHISRKAHLILPTHKLLDAASEASKGDKKIGSTLRGITPSYRDKIGRDGLRVGDIETPGFKARYDEILQRHIQTLKNFDQAIDIEEQEIEFFSAIEFLRTLNLVDSENLLHKALRENKKILAEGAQGSLLDIEFGSYPFVTSSNTTAAGACTGLGVPPSSIKRVYGIFKAYCTRVGSGPFPTELTGETGEEIRKKGNEYGSTTGRPRRTGWLDIPALNYAINLSGVTDLIMTKADVLTGMDTLSVATAYIQNGKQIEAVPFDLDTPIEPVLRQFPGWKTDLESAGNFSELPVEMKNYIRFVEQETGVPVTYLSVGPDRDQTLALEHAEKHS